MKASKAEIRYFERQLENLNCCVEIISSPDDQRHLASFISDPALAILDKIFKAGKHSAHIDILNYFEKPGHDTFSLIFQHNGERHSFFITRSVVRTRGPK